VNWEVLLESRLVLEIFVAKRADSIFSHVINVPKSLKNAQEKIKMNLDTSRDSLFRVRIKFTLLLMSKSVAGNTKCRVAESAREWLLPRMGECVSDHIAFIRSYLVANLATPHLNSMLKVFFNLKYVRQMRFQNRNQVLILRIYFVSC